MAKAITIRLRPDQRESLERRRRTHPDPRVRRRAGIVLMSDDGWKFTRHALSRAVDMALDVEEILGVLDRPKMRWTSDKYPDTEIVTNYRISLAYYPNEKLIVTIVWYKLPSSRYDRDDMDAEMGRIRDK